MKDWGKDAVHSLWVAKTSSAARLLAFSRFSEGRCGGIVNLSEICGKPRDPPDGKWRYPGVFFLGLTSGRARIGLS